MDLVVPRAVVVAVVAAVASDDVVARRPYRPLLVLCYGLWRLWLLRLLTMPTTQR
jgi:hypothetical protein